MTNVEKKNIDPIAVSRQAAKRVSDYTAKYNQVKQRAVDYDKEALAVANQTKKDTTKAVKYFYALVVGIYKEVYRYDPTDQEMFQNVVNFNHKYGQARRHLMLHFPVWSDVFEEYYYFIVAGKGKTVVPFNYFLKYLEKHKGTNSTDYLIAKAVWDWRNFTISSSPNCVWR